MTSFTEKLREEELEFKLKWIDKIPYLDFPSSWLIKAVPSFDLKIIRYHITKKNLKGYIGIFLDLHDSHAKFGEPYWEITDIDEYFHRVKMNDIKGLKKRIRIALNQLLKKEEKKK